MARYNLMELMVCVAARQLEDGKSAIIGTGMPLAAAMLAQNTASPNLIIMFEAGGVAPKMRQLPISVADSNSQTDALLHTSMDVIMEACQRGTIDYTFLGGAQIDMYGNINSTMIGTDFNRPKVRLPGSGGANDLASLCWKTLTITPHDKRRFAKKLDFLTTPGYLDGPGGRERAGYRHGGPACVISDRALLRFDGVSKEMYLDRYYPGTTPEEIQSHTGFALDLARAAPVDPPTAEELCTLRQKVDPQRLILGGS
jgi:glutaconate CoA-transferase subunit B